MAAGVEPVRGNDRWRMEWGGGGGERFNPLLQQPQSDQCLAVTSNSLPSILPFVIQGTQSDYSLSNVVNYAGNAKWFVKYRIVLWLLVCYHTQGLVAYSNTRIKH